MKTILKVLLLTAVVILSSCSNKKIESLEIANKELQQKVEMLTKQIQFDRMRADSTAVIAVNLKNQLDDCQKQIKGRK